QSAARLRCLAAGGEPLIVGARQRVLHDTGEVAAVVYRPVGGAVGGGVVRHEVAQPQGDAVESVFAGSVVDQPLDDEGYVRPAGATVGGHRHRVGVDQPRAHVQRRHAIDTAHRDGKVPGADQAAPIAAVGAEVRFMLE